MASRTSLDAMNAYRKGVFAGKQRQKSKAPDNISLELTGLWQQGHSVGLQMPATKPLQRSVMQISENKMVSESEPHLADFLNEDVAKEAIAQASAEQSKTDASAKKTHDLYSFTEEPAT